MGYVHPIVVEASLKAQQGPGGIDFSYESLREIEASLRQTFQHSSPAMARQALESLIDLAGHLKEERHAEEAANKLLEVAALVATPAGTPPSESGEEIHPIIAQVSMLVSQHQDKLHLTPEAVQAVRDMVADYASVGDVQAPLLALVDVARHLQVDRGAPDAAKAVLDIVAEFAAHADSGAPEPKVMPDASALLTAQADGSFAVTVDTVNGIRKSLTGIGDDRQFLNAFSTMLGLTAELQDKGRAGAVHGTDLLFSTLLDVALTRPHPLEPSSAYDRLRTAAARAAIMAIRENGMVALSPLGHANLEREAMHLAQGSKAVQPGEDEALHPIVAEASLLISSDPKGKISISPAGVAALRESLSRLPQDRVLDALRGLTALASHIAVDRGEQQLAETLLGLVTERFSSMTA